MHESSGEQRRTMVREAIAAYAIDVAGIRDDLDDLLEIAAIEAWEDLD